MSWGGGHLGSAGDCEGSQLSELPSCYSNLCCAKKSIVGMSLLLLRSGTGSICLYKNRYVSHCMNISWVREMKVSIYFFVKSSERDYWCLALTFYDTVMMQKLRKTMYQYILNVTYICRIYIGLYLQMTPSSSLPMKKEGRQIINAYSWLHVPFFIIFFAHQRPVSVNECAVQSHLTFRLNLCTV